MVQLYQSKLLSEDDTHKVATLKGCMLAYREATGLVDRIVTSAERADQQEKKTHDGTRNGGPEHDLTALVGWGSPHFYR